jgi:cyclopropane-fatty-acyl-phospholipid synthase
MLESFLSKFVRSGHLEVEMADGAVCVFGDRTGPRLRIRFSDRAPEREIVLDPELNAGQLYVDGRIEVIHGDLYDLLALSARNLRAFDGPRWPSFLRATRLALRRLKQRNAHDRARSNVARHYDFDPSLYDLFLDNDRQYSCAYFERADQGLDEAQQAKNRHVAAKLLIDERHSILDIGSGFGGLALYLARVTGARATGVTLSHEQHLVAVRRAAAAGLEGRVDFRLQDYRDVEGTFDRIVSVGMFEHVGIGHFDEFFANAHRLLAEDGVMLLHAIGHSETPSPTNPWIEKYIFPGGYIPSLSEVFAAIERSRLLVTDAEILRLHYADTLKAWRARFLAHREEAQALYDERFCRMWEFYLAGSETSFRIDGNMVFQIQLAKRQDVVPRTRDYITERQKQLLRREKPALGSGP